MSFNGYKHSLQILNLALGYFFFIFIINVTLILFRDIKNKLNFLFSSEVVLLESNEQPEALTETTPVSIIFLVNLYH